MLADLRPDGWRVAQRQLKANTDPPPASSRENRKKKGAFRTQTRTDWGPVLILVMLLGTEAFGREWTSASGQHKTEAELVKVENGNAWLERPNQKPFAVKLSQLSQEDRDHITGIASLGRDYDPKNPAIPPRIARFVTAGERQREAEIARRQRRITSLRKSIRAATAQRAAKARRELSDEIKEHTKRIREIQRAVIYMPQISPEGMPGARARDAFRGGQIGMLDEGFNYSSHHLAKGKNNSLEIWSLRRGRELRIGRTATYPVGPSGGPAQVYEAGSYQDLTVEGNLALLLEGSKSIAKDGSPISKFNPNSKFNRLLRSYVFVVEERQRDDPKDRSPRFVLKPFVMQPINDWLKEPLKTPKWSYPTHWQSR